MFHNIIFQSIASYLNNYEDRIVRRYPQQKERAEYLGDNILSIGFESILSSDRDAIDSLAKRIIREIQLYSKESGVYKKFKENIFKNCYIDSDPGNDMFYIMKGIKQFRELNPNIKLPFLSNLYNFLPKNNLDTKNNRKLYLNTIKNL